MSDPYLASVSLFALTYAPLGYLYCQGQLLQISEYQAMFSLLSTIFGGDGRSTFGLPDLQGRVPVGLGSGTALTPRMLAQIGGGETQTLTLAQMPNHTHDAYASVTADVSVQPMFAANSTLFASTTGANSRNPTSNSILADSNNGSGPTYIYVTPPSNPTALNSSSVTTSITQVTATEIDVSVDVTIDGAGGNAEFSIMPPFLVLPYCIAVEGIYPPRPN